MTALSSIHPTPQPHPQSQPQRPQGGLTRFEPPPPTSNVPPPQNQHQQWFRSNKILHQLSLYGEVGQFVAVVVLFLLSIHIIASIVWITISMVADYIAIASIITTLSNVTIIVAIFLRMKSALVLWLWFHGILMVVGAINDFKTIPLSMIIITASCFLAVYMLLQTFDHNIRVEVRCHNAFPNMAPPRSNEHGNGNGGAGSDFTSSRFEQRPQQVMRVRDTRFTDRELMTISETIAAQEIVIQQRYAAYMRLLTASDSELPSYEDMVKTLEEEKQQQKMKKCESPPSYSQVVMDIEKSHRHMPDVE